MGLQGVLYLLHADEYVFMAVDCAGDWAGWVGAAFCSDRRVARPQPSACAAVERRDSQGALVVPLVAAWVRALLSCWRPRYERLPMVFSHLQPGNSSAGGPGVGADLAARSAELASAERAGTGSAHTCDHRGIRPACAP